MNEAEWLSCTDPAPMLAFLGSKASARKLRLFVVACCRRIGDSLHDRRSQAAIEIAEQFADGKADSAQLADAHAEALAASSELGDDSYDAPAYAAALAAGSPLDATDAAELAAEGVTSTPAELLQEKAAQARLLRDILGNPFRPPAGPGPAVLAWHGGAIVELARALQDRRCCKDLQALAAALEQAGCADPDVLSHCRARGEHVRGCWVVDLLLGFE